MTDCFLHLHCGPNALICSHYFSEVQPDLHQPDVSIALLWSVVQTMQLQNTLLFVLPPFFKSVYPGLVYAVILHHPPSAHLGEHPCPGKQKLPLQRVLLLPYGLLIPGHDKHVPTETSRNDSNQTSLKGHLSTRRRSNGTRRASRISELPPPSPGGCVQPSFGWNKF